MLFLQLPKPKHILYTYTPASRTNVLSYSPSPIHPHTSVSLHFHPRRKRIHPRRLTTSDTLLVSTRGSPILKTTGLLMYIHSAHAHAHAREPHHHTTLTLLASTFDTSAGPTHAKHWPWSQVPQKSRRYRLFICFFAWLYFLDLAMFCSGVFLFLIREMLFWLDLGRHGQQKRRIRENHDHWRFLFFLVTETVRMS